MHCSCCAAAEVGCAGLQPHHPQLNRPRRRGVATLFRTQQDIFLLFRCAAGCWSGVSMTAQMSLKAVMSLMCRSGHSCQACCFSCGELLMHTWGRHLTHAFLRHHSQCCTFCGTSSSQLHLNKLQAYDSTSQLLYHLLTPGASMTRPSEAHQVLQMLTQYPKQLFYNGLQAYDSNTQLLC
jgi:hypothetical protein